MTECTPQELLPIMPPNVAYWCVEVSGAKVRSCSGSVMFASWSRMTPGSTRAICRSGSISRIRRMCLEVSTTTATFVVSPERLVAQPRGSTGALWRLQTSTAATTSSASSGITTARGGWR